MIKKTIGIATILLLILVIVLSVGIRSSKANTVSTYHTVNELRAVDLARLGVSHREPLLKGVNLNPALAVVERHGVLASPANLVLSSNALPVLQRPNVTLAQRLHGLDSPFSRV